MVDPNMEIVPRSNLPETPHPLQYIVPTTAPPIYTDRDMFFKTIKVDGNLPILNYIMIGRMIIK